MVAVPQAMSEALMVIDSDSDNEKKKAVAYLKLLVYVECSKQLQTLAEGFASVKFLEC